MVCDRSGDGNHHFCDLQMTANDVKKAEKTKFLLEMQSKVTAKCDNYSGTKSKTWGFGWGEFKTTTKTRSRKHKKSLKKLCKQQTEQWRPLVNLDEQFVSLKNGKKSGCKKPTKIRP